VAVIVALVRIDMPPPASKPQGSLGQSLRAGVRHVAHDPTIRVLMMLAGISSFLAFPLITYMPAVADTALGTGAAGYSLLLSSFGAGAIVGAITTAQRGNRPGRGRLLLAAFVFYAVAAMGALASRVQPLTMALLFVAGISLVTAMSTLNSLVQEHAPNELRGRIVSIYGLAFRGGSPLGSVVAGFLVGPFGAPLVLGTFSAALLVIVIGVRLRGGRLPSL
jgi:predicted MFS family arabinose efflux permease